MTTAASSSLDGKQPSSKVISFIQSQKRKPLLVSDKYLFKLNKSTTTKKYWICTLTECSAKTHTNTNDHFIKMIGEHCHSAESEMIDVREFRENVKQRAIHETTPIQRIYDEECAKAILSTAAIAILPSEREINSAFNKARRGLTPTIPTTQLFDIPDPYTKTLKNNDFLVVDKMITRRQRMILFLSPEQLKMLFTAETIFMDGTFSSCPKIFDQIYTIHSIKYEQSFPCVFGLLPNRLKSTYQFLFFELKAIAVQMKPDFTPKLVMSDFEPALIGVLKAKFSTAKHSSCYFHFTQAVYRNIQRLRLSSSYNNDDAVKHLCRQLMALPLLPEPVIEYTYDELASNLSTTMSTVMNDLLIYFQEQWFVKVSTSQWCVHGFAMRTNNNAEVFHGRFNRRVQVTHSNIWSFIKFLQGEECRFHHIYTQFTAGLGARTKQVKTISIQRRIDNLDKRYYDDLIHVMEYLDGLSFTVAKRKK
ncbi:unnamed protein product [Rotaria magnacalcarata]|uniref:MULE transposase domain-containing protein n=1 Tax=Rotaria magnacalcarata TaxID=392030 RepID=A0A816QE97_9BILA|nr:unnamed protein product [Rotaria magnacalcarata]CAF4180122.1 unnamed protein product [Rotaria magnacalcarata]